MTTLAPFGMLVPVFNSMSSSAQRIADRRRRLEPNGLVGAALHEQPIGVHELGVLGVILEPLEDVVAAPG